MKHSDALIKAVATVVREYVSRAIGEALARVTALEARPVAQDGRDGRDGVPGTTGLDGAPGRDGVDGKPGADGLGFDHFEELYDGERTFTHRYRQGARLKEFVWKVPMEIYRGVYVEGRTYEPGDGVTYASSEWHCSETTTTKPGEGAKAWTLKVRRGRDGKDGRDAPGAGPR